MTPNRRTTGIFRSLGFRLALVVGAALGIGLSAFLVTSMSHHEAALLTLKKEEASLLASTIQSSLNHSMLQCEEGRQSIREMIQRMGSQRVLERVRIFNAEGLIQYSTHPGEIGRLVDKEAENCKHCHSGAGPSGRADPEVARLFYTPASAEGASHRVLGVIHPIYNDMTSCRPCHQDKPVLGKLDVVISLENLDADIRLHRGALILFGFLGVGGIIAIVIAAIQLLIHRPVAALVDGTRRIGSLDLDHRLPADRKDELGNLAVSFNEMAARLQRARAKIREFTDSLEEKVEQKSRELQSAQLSMLRAEKMAAIGQMAAGVAHEINNPLTGVITFATLVKRRVKDEGLKEDLDTIIEEAHRCSKIARGLLDFARGGRLSPQNADVNLVVARTLALVEKQALFHNIDIVRQLSERLPPVSLDADRIGQVFLNLVMNAAEAMGGSGRLILTTQPVADWEGGGEAVRVTVEDTGPGIPEDIAVRIFDPFFTTKEPGQGTGLGLAVSYGIVEDHGGRIRVSGRPGKGARFTVTLPVAGTEA